MYVHKLLFRPGDTNFRHHERAWALKKMHAETPERYVVFWTGRELAHDDAKNGYEASLEPVARATTMRN